MRQLGILLRLNLASLLSSPQQRTRKNGAPAKKGTGRLVGMALLLGFLFLFFAFLAFCILMVMVISLQEAGGDMAFYPSFATMVAFVLCLVGSTFAAQSALYHARDNELLLSLPLRPVTILLSRMALLLCVNLFFAAIIAVPAFLVYLLFAEAAPGGILLFALCLLVVPFFSLCVSCFLGWLVSLVASHIRHKNLWYTVLMVALFALYMAMCFGMEGIMTELEENILPFITAMSPFLTFFSWVGRAVVSGEWLYAVLFFLLFLAVAAVTLFFLSRTYLSLVSAGRTGERIVYREKREKRHSPFLAFLRREVTHFVSSPAYMFNEGIGLLLVLGLPILLLVYRDTVFAALEMLEMPGLSGLLTPSCIGSLCLLSSLVIISAPSVSLEGKNLWIARIAPVEPYVPLLAKAGAHVAIASPFFLLASVLSAIAVRASVWEVLFLLLVPLAAVLFSALLGVAMNVVFPRLDWVNESSALKNGMAVFLTQVLAMLMALAMGCVMGFSALATGMPSAVSLLLCLVLYGVADAGLYAYLRGAGARRFARL